MRGLAVMRGYGLEDIDLRSTCVEYVVLRAAGGATAACAVPRQHRRKMQNILRGSLRSFSAFSAIRSGEERCWSMLCWAP